MMPATFVHELPFGATLLDRARTRFRFWAPAQERVLLEVVGRQPVAMCRQEGGWFEQEADCGAGAEYRFRLGEGPAVPDPASRCQSGDVHDASLVVDPARYQWCHSDWQGRPWREAVIYELHAGALGGFAGVKGKLSALAQLGVTAIELMPVADFPGRRNWGYDGVLPFAPDTAYGTPDELKSLIDAAHGLGLMVFLDVVYNHFGPDGNYLGLYAPQLFLADRSTGWGPTINFGVPELRRFFAENALYWLMEYRFDGLRLDAVHAIPDRSWLEEMAGEVARHVEPGRQVHLVLENDDNSVRLLEHGFRAQWNDDGHHVLHVLLTGEADGYYQDYAREPATLLARCLKEGFIYQGEGSAYRDDAPRGEPSAVLAPTSFVLFLQNHDQIGNRAHGERLTELVRPEAVEAALALLLLCPQIPLLFMGEEVASRSPFAFFTDHNAELAEKVRDGRRAEFAKFAARLHRAIPDPNDPETLRQSIPETDPLLGTRRRALVERLLTTRRNAIVPYLDEARAIESGVLGKAAVWAAWRLAGRRTLTILANLGTDRVQAPQPPGALIFQTQPGPSSQGREQVWLDPHTTKAFLDVGS